MIAPIFTRRHFSFAFAATAFAPAVFALGSSGYMDRAALQRIVSTAPSSTEALFALGLGAHVVGVSTFCEYPPSVKALPKVGTYVKPDLEAIARLRPDLVVLQQHPGPLTERLSALGIRFVELPYGTLADVFTGIGLLAAAASVPEQGMVLNRTIRQRLDGVRAQANRVPRVRTCVIADRRGGLLADLIAVGPGNYINEIIGIAGGQNLLDHPGLPMYPRISLETILRENPEVIVDLTDAHTLDAAHQGQREQDLALWSKQTTLAAVRAKRVFLGDNSVLLVPGPRTPEAAEQIFHFLHQAPA